MENFIRFCLDKFADMGYTGVFILMTIESSFIPFPSEVVIPPAAYLSSKGDMNIFLVIIFGILGSQVGALINYFLAYYLGRVAIYGLASTRFAKICMITPEKIQKSEEYFNKYGSVSTFIGRLIPVVRQLISIPAGLAKMNIFYFLLYTTIGATIWVTILALLGYYFGENQDLIFLYSKEIGIAITVVLIIIIVLYILKKRKMKFTNIIKVLIDKIR
jgi:membrane protein DedA with SNARE-associated domain